MAKNEEVIEEDVGRDHREGVPREGSGVGGGYEETAEQGVEKGEEEAEKAYVEVFEYGSCHSGALNNAVEQPGRKTAGEHKEHDG